MSARKKPCTCGKGHPRFGRCRASRPLCPLRRARPCHCDGYHFPHRPRSPLCEDNPMAQERRNEVLYGRSR